jgi:hypothetical protein
VLTDQQAILTRLSTTIELGELAIGFAAGET